MCQNASSENHESARQCPLCGSTEYEGINGTPYFRCGSCQLWYQYPPPRHVYELPSHVSVGHLMGTHEQNVNRSLAEHLWQTYRPTSVLDVGSRYPYLLHVLKNLGVEGVQGVDACEKALEYGEQLGVPVWQTDFFDVQVQSRFDLVVMMHVLEHFADPRQALRQVKSVLRPNGIFFARLPTTDLDISSDLTAEHYMVHPILFNEKSLRRLLKEEGFEILSLTVGTPIITNMDVHAVYPGDGERVPMPEGSSCQSTSESGTQKDERGASTYYINNRPEIGDTLSLRPLIKEVRKNDPSAKIVVREDRHGLLKDLGVEIDPNVEATAMSSEGDPSVNPIFHQWWEKYEYGNYLWRTNHFYNFPIALAQTLGWLPKTLKLPSPVAPLDLPPLPETGFAVDGAVAVVPGTGHVGRRWPLERWRRVVQWLRAKDLPVLILGKQEPMFPGEDWDLSGRTTVLEDAAIIKRARLVVSADTMAVHLARAVGTRGVVLIGPTDPTFSFPPGNLDFVYGTGNCRGCFYRLSSNKPYRNWQQPPIYHSCNWQQPSCMEEITVQRVVDTVSQALGMGVLPPRLAICMMVKNESAGLLPALRSTIGIADELVVVDTGSIDGTQDIVQKFVAEHPVSLKLLDYDAGDPFRSFAEVRNHAFRNATAKYVMWLDAGDRIEGHKALAHLIQEEKADVVQLRTIYGELAYWRERVAPQWCATFVDDVHETMEIGGLRILNLTQTTITHVHQQKHGREDSLQRNVRLLRGMIEREKPTHPRFSRWVYYLAQDLAQSGNAEEAERYYRIRTKLGGFHEERGHAFRGLIAALLQKCDYAEALCEAYDMLKVVDDWRDPYYLVGDCYFWMSQYHKAILWYEHCLRIPEPSTSLWKWNDVYTWLPDYQLSLCYGYLSRHEDALKYAMRSMELSPPARRAFTAARVTAMTQLVIDSKHNKA